MNVKEIAKVLKSLPGLADAQEDVLLALAAQFTRKVLTDDFVCREGEPADSLFVLTAGKLDVYKRSEEGNERLVAHLTPICLFGNVAVVNWGNRTASVHAPKWAEVLEIPAFRVRQLIDDWDFTVASPLRRALIVATGWQIAQANRTIGHLAIDAGIAERVPGYLSRPGRASDAPAATPAEGGPVEPPLVTEETDETDVERRLLAARSRM